MQILVIVLLALTYQLPGIVIQNSLSFENNSASVPIAGYNSLVTLYPTGTTFDVPNIGAQAPNGDAEYNDVRLVQNRFGTDYYVGVLTYISPGQINAELLLASCPVSTGGGSCGGSSVVNQSFGAVRLQRKVSGVWVDKSSSATLYVDANGGTPHSSTVYSGSPLHNGDLYIYNGVSYVFYKKTLSNAASPLPGYSASDNPIIVNGQNSIVASYVTGMLAVGAFGPCEAKLYLGGSDASGQLQSGYVNSGFNGVQQINWFVPTNMSDSTTIQFRGKYQTPFPTGCDVVTPGNSNTIPNWK